MSAISTVLITGAKSGSGLEAVARLAQSGVGRVILVCGTLNRAESARKSRICRVEISPFETLAVDLGRNGRGYKLSLIHI